MITKEQMAMYVHVCAKQLFETWANVPSGYDKVRMDIVLKFIPISFCF